MKKKTNDLINQNIISLLFSKFAKKTADLVGHPITFSLALITVIIWACTGPYFHYSETWQLIINTGTTIITFLIVFIIQHTQNRDTEIMNIKIDELIKGHKGAENRVLDLNNLSDAELKEIEDCYKKICNKKTGK